MIKIHFTSGLGNQLFQFFFGESISKKKNIKIQYIDSCLPPEQLKLWEIFDIKHKGNYSFNFLKITKKKILRIIYINLIRLSIKLKLNHFFKIYSDNTFKVNDFKNYSFIKKNNFYGYWQNYNFFNQYFFDIKNTLKFKKKLNIKKVLNLAKEVQLIGIHIRGGDYENIKNKKLFFKVDKNFYLLAVKIAKENFPNLKFLVFSDDIHKAKKFLGNFDKDLLYVEDISQNRDDDFQLLSQCDHFIIPNSTFSLWAAYLSPNKKKTLISPKKWLKDNKNNFDQVDQSLFNCIFI